jgi:hypothetical protein
MLAVAVMMCVTNGALRLSVTNDDSNLDAMIAARSVPIDRRFSGVRRPHNTAERIAEYGEPDS